jgi:hypothetical protein
MQQQVFERFPGNRHPQLGQPDPVGLEHFARPVELFQHRQLALV